MTEYCTFSFSSWEPDSALDPDSLVEYVFDNACSAQPHHERPHLKDHFSHACMTFSSPRLHISKQHGDGTTDSEHSMLTIQCKPVYDVAIAGVSVASEARIIEVYDARDGSYLQTVRGRRDTEDSEADDSLIHFMCHCTLQAPLSAIKIKFLSLGQRESFELARIKLVLQSCPVQNVSNFGQTVNLEKLRSDVDSMGDTVSDRAKAFLTTLENFQKNKRGTVDDMRKVLMGSSSATGAEGQSLAGIASLLSMFATAGLASPAPSGVPQQTEGSMVNTMLSQMMSSMAVQQPPSAGGGGGERKDSEVYKFMLAMCSQVSQLRTAEEKEAADQGSQGEGTVQDKASGQRDTVEGASASAELESRVTANVEAMMESRLSAVEQSIKEDVDQRMQEMESRVTGKLDAIFALLQNSQKQS